MGVHTNLEAVFFNVRTWELRQENVVSFYWSLPFAEYDDWEWIGEF